MKKITLLAAFFAAFAMNAQTVLFETDFEGEVVGDNVGEDTDIPADFMSYDVDGDGFNWGLSNPVNFTQPFGDLYVGNFIASASYITNGAGGNGGQGALSPNNILVLPMVSIPDGAVNVEFSYLVGSGTDPDFFSETYSVTVTNSSDEADILAATPILSTTLAFQGIETVTLNLDDYVGQDVYIAFRHHDTTDQWLLGLDDLRVQAEVLSVVDFAFNNFSHYVANEQLVLNADKLDLFELSTNTIKLLNYIAEKKSINIINKIPESFFIKADKNMLSTILRNLISNAIKFTPKGGKIEIGCVEINHDLSLTQIYVKDTGVGIKKETQKKIFSISENTSTQGTEKESGTGLGLIICKEFVEKHGGEIWLESEVKKGSTFTFSIPIDE